MTNEQIKKKEIKSALAQIPAIDVLETSKELTVKSISLSIPIETLLFAKTVIYKYRVKSNRLTFYNRKIFFKVFTIKNLQNRFRYVIITYVVILIRPSATHKSAETEFFRHNLVSQE